MRILILFLATAAALVAQHPVDQYNVVWTTPSKNSWGSMPLGNGDLGLNVWVEENGDLLLYAGKTDAWSETVRLLKLGRIRVRFSPSPFSPGDPFRQTLNLRTGEIQIHAGKPGNDLRLSIWVDANNPAVRIEGDTAKNAEMHVTYERWRDQQRLLEGEEVQSAHGLQNGPEPLISYGDSIQLDTEEGVVWYHRNPKSAWSGILRHQGLSDAIKTIPDPLLNRTFGAAMAGENLVRINSTTLRSKEPALKHALNIYAHTAVAPSSEAWVGELRAVAARVSGIKLETRKASHERWWLDFWDRSYVRVTGGEAQRKITQAYTLQRFVNACGGRGAYPIKANGSIFTMDAKLNDLSFDADFRKGGGAYSFRQNRLVYWPMLASGDFDLALPFLSMYADNLHLARTRAKLYFNHDGFLFPETMYFFTAYPNLDYGWHRQGKNAAYVENPELRYYYSHMIELLYLMTEYSLYTDKGGIRRTVPILADDLLAFYDAHYQRQDEKLRFFPAQALDTWTEAVNPVPEIAGFRALLNILIDRKIPLSKQSLANAKRLLAQIPDYPTVDAGGVRVLAAAERTTGERKGEENPELYSIFPFKQFGVDKPDLDLAVRTFEKRKNKLTGITRTDAIQAAYLGLAAVAKDLITKQLEADQQVRFPGFWTTGDGTPDQTQGNIGMMALQTMLLQSDGDRILVAPAWPKDWDVDFKLVAPGNTVVEGSIREGKIDRLRTIPEARVADVKRFDPQ